MFVILLPLYIPYRCLCLHSLLTDQELSQLGVDRIGDGAMLRQRRRESDQSKDVP